LKEGDFAVVAVAGPPSEAKKAVLFELQRQIGKVQLWRFETLFRAVIFLLMTYAEQTGGELRDVLSRPEMLAAGIEMVEEMADGKSIGQMVGDADSMMSMSQNFQQVVESTPLASEFAQGEVINFVQKELSKMSQSGTVVLLDGYEETLQYIDTPHRFST